MMMQMTECPVVKQLAAEQPLLWQNPRLMVQPTLPYGHADIADAEARLQRFAPYIACRFPETAAQGGIIESPLCPILGMQTVLTQNCGGKRGGTLLLKCDSHLPVSGSIKARGGIYEVLKYAETLALQHGLLAPGDCYDKLARPAAQELFSQYSLAVGSTGNLGLSIGLMGAALGFRVTVHMSADARLWKKDLLRSCGVQVVEYADDYSLAVQQGRAQAQQDPRCHFVDDENSVDLFLGYATAAGRLERQLQQAGYHIGAQQPLYVYLPCGVGGGPGGVAFGLKQIFGQYVHCYFVEPTHAPCMTLGLVTGLHRQIAVSDIGLDGRTAADGLAVGRASAFVGKMMEQLLDGCVTDGDDSLFIHLAQLADSEDIWIEPSACIGFSAYEQICRRQLAPDNAVHIVWATGGSMVPVEEMQHYYQQGKALLK